MEYFKYDQNQDQYICPEGKQLHFKDIENHISANGYQTERRVYQCNECNTCSCRDACTTSKTGRSIQVSFRLNELRQQARDNLQSDLGKKLMKNIYR
ncbi:MAG: hypothetical protein DKM50_02960 [Candidatus Margulisiibacteriota bacterium]|nr:MAG: hypothetical protein DKM50_02960 [Candidatus Margulisiibacteriota bacterium]HAR62256.1 hypothetical protein [Candidatus Margulisiibacteriota bacterium]HCT84047.1 hypothetical protein [Candidatus Margulisiibacteriota bacterium]HCY36198.1 hypothetical protein [Candidatus Margulisiibacteriota bacterium]